MQSIGIWVAQFAVSPPSSNFGATSRDQLFTTEAAEASAFIGFRRDRLACHEAQRFFIYLEHIL
jgi:hypothetical protein